MPSSARSSTDWMSSTRSPRRRQPRAARTRTFRSSRFTSKAQSGRLAERTVSVACRRAERSLDRPGTSSYDDVHPVRDHPPHRHPSAIQCHESDLSKESRMAHVVAEPCFDCKYTDCVVVCPVDCFYEGAQMLYIHPDECIDCEACVPECPVEAIFHEDNLPEEWKDFTALNAEEAVKCPVLNEKKDALEGESCDKTRKKK